MEVPVPVSSRGRVTTFEQQGATWAQTSGLDAPLHARQLERVPVPLPADAGDPTAAGAGPGEPAP